MVRVPRDNKDLGLPIAQSASKVLKVFFSRTAAKLLGFRQHRWHSDLGLDFPFRGAHSRSGDVLPALPGEAVGLHCPATYQVECSDTHRPASDRLVFVRSAAVMRTCVTWSHQRRSTPL
jgi:hypothetical protein